MEDCPICLEEMQEEDLHHPLQCLHHCGYNFCQTCIESLMLLFYERPVRNRVVGARNAKYDLK